MVPVETDYADHDSIFKLGLWQGCTLADGWVADVKFGFMADDEDAIADGFDMEGTIVVFVVPEDGAKLLTPGGSGTVPAEDDVAAFLSSYVGEVEDGERGLAEVVVKHEFVGGGGAAPGPADGAAAEDVLGRQPDEYLFGDDLLGQVVEEGCAAAVRHAD